ncbi:hypothetical protein OG252_42645 [Streptomyces sp. NBC_01352]|uniref:hypothetical protein n=1 Tax=unclassified Streptomyces TaxID=2593676 RepID=UPI00224D8B97|nr:MULTISPECIES: hypothetical protein [unclassified Streptomyces]MCX4702639.1 hypothetical protein [Streptomyces sp. NBC_01373]
MSASVARLTARLAETAPGPRVESGPGALGRYAYDASNHRVPPQAVAFFAVADGFSRAPQIDHLVGDRGVRALHLAELLDPAADQPGETS